ncbi:MAG TPA: methylmalonyl-CoA mutase family protein, partial [Caulobacteraceae bacterium]|nr:methylmalonyl-CoA mutase family protein [Caulobacteraceae bacterium]
DPWVNLLRLTAAGFGAGVGGADTVLLEPFTQPLGLASDLARRQARNTQLVLMEEAHLGRVADPAGGSWYLERLTDDLARAGWAVFQAEVAAARDARLAAIAEKRTPLLGVTVFPNAQETPVAVESVDRDGLAHAFDVRQPGDDTTCAALTPIRWSEGFEGDAR